MYSTSFALIISSSELKWKSADQVLYWPVPPYKFLSTCLSHLTVPAAHTTIHFIPSINAYHHPEHILTFLLEVTYHTGSRTSPDDYKYPWDLRLPTLPSQPSLFLNFSVLKGSVLLLLWVWCLGNHCHLFSFHHSPPVTSLSAACFISAHIFPFTKISFKSFHFTRARLFCLYTIPLSKHLPISL